LTETQRLMRFAHVQRNCNTSVLQLLKYKQQVFWKFFYCRIARHCMASQ